jgi:hypothetical protein
MSQTEQKATVLGETPDLRALLRAMEDERLNTEKLAQQTSGEVVLEDGTGTGDPSALVLRDQAVEAKNNAETAVGASGLDGIVDTETGLPAAGNHGGDYYLVHSDSSGRSEAVYRSDGTSWSFTGIALLNEGQTGSPNGVAELDGTTTVPASQISEDSVEQHAPAVHLQSHIDAGQAGLTFGANVSSADQSQNSSILQGLVDQASSGNSILQFPRGVIEHDEPLRLYSTTSNNFDDGGGLRMEGVQQRLKDYQGFGTRLKYVGDPSIIPYQFSAPKDAHRRLQAHELNFQGATNRGVPLLRVHSTFQGSELQSLYLRQNGEGDGMLVRDSWVGQVDNIIIERDDSRPFTNGVGFQFHNDNFGAGNQRLSRINASGFRYAIVLGGLENGQGGLNVTTKCTHLNGFECHVGVVHGQSAGGGVSDDTYTEAFSKAGLWVINGAGRPVNKLWAAAFDGDNASIQLGMDKDAPYTGTVDATNGATLRDTATDFGDRGKAISRGDVVYNTSTSRPYDRTYISGLKTEKERGNGASGAVHEIGLADDIFASGDNYAISCDLDDRTATVGQRETTTTATLDGPQPEGTINVVVSAGSESIDLQSGHLIRVSGERYTVRDDVSISANGSGTIPIQEPGLFQDESGGTQITTIGQFDGTSGSTGTQKITSGAEIDLAGAFRERNVVVRYDASIRTGRNLIKNISGYKAASGFNDTVSANSLIDSSASFDTNEDVKIGDTVYNVDEGTSAEVTDIVSSSELALSADIFTSTGAEYSVTGVILVYNNPVVTRGLEVEEIEGREEYSAKVYNRPESVAVSKPRGGEAKEHTNRPKRYAGPLFEKVFRESGTFSLSSSLKSVDESVPRYGLLAIGEATEMQLPPPSDPKVTERLLCVHRLDDGSSGDEAKVTCPNGALNGTGVNGSGELILNGRDAIWIYAAYIFGSSYEWQPVQRQVDVDISALTDNTGGTTDGTLAQVSGTGDDATVNNNLAELNAKIDALITQLSS